MRMPEFHTPFVERWNEVAFNEIEQMMDFIRDTAHTYQRDFERNFERWPIMGVYVWPNPNNVWIIDTFMGQVAFLLDYLDTRREWLDYMFNCREPNPNWATCWHCETAMALWPTR